MQIVNRVAERIREIHSGSSKWTHLLVGILAGLLLGFVLSSVLRQFSDGATPTARLIKVHPSPDETVPLDADICLQFSNDIVSEDETGQLFSADIIQVQPRLSGQYVWQTPRQLRFLPDRPLLPSTKYSGTIDLSAIPVRGGHLQPVTKTVEFSTERLSVLDARLSSEPVLKDHPSATIRLEVEFNYEVSASQVLKHLTLTNADSGDPVVYSISPDDGRSTLFAVIPGPMQSSAGGALDLTIGAGLMCADGSLGLADDYTEKFALPIGQDMPELEVYWVRAGNHYSLSPDTSCVSIGFSDLVDCAVLRQAVTIDPEVAFSVESHDRELVLTSDSFRPRDTYTVTLSSDLISQSGAKLDRDFTATVTMPDLEPRVEFDDPGMYLPRYGLQSVAVTSVNVEEVEVAVYQVFRNNLAPLFSFSHPDSYQFEDDLEKAGKLIDVQTFETKGDWNTEQVVHVDLSRYASPEHSGVYGVVVRDKYHRWLSDSRLVISSDLGVTFKASSNDLVAFVCSIESLSPVAGATVSVLSSNNQEIASSTTDQIGVARINELKSVLSEFSPYIVTVESGTDFSFLPLDVTSINMVDFDVSGRDVLEHGYEAFLYMDRELFRPGDVAHVAAFIRGPNMSIPQPLPTRIVVNDPSGRVFRELPVKTDDSGSLEFAVDIPDYAMSGEYTVSLLVAEREIGHCTFMVEEFVPERIRVDVKLDSDTYTKGDSAVVEVSAESLIGAKAAGRQVELSVLLEPIAFAPADFLSYCFSDSSREYSPSKEIITAGTLSEEGTWQHSHELTTGQAPSSALRAEFEATVTEIGGRASRGYSSAIYHPYDRYVGVKLDAGRYVELGQQVEIACTAVDPSGTPVPEADLIVQVYTVRWNTIYRRSADGRYQYDARRTEEKVFEESLRLEGSVSQRLQYAVQRYGAHRVVVSDVSTENGHRACVEFYATGGESAVWQGTSPEELTVDLDAESYTPGSLAKVSIASPFAGRAFVTVERERVFRYFVVDVSEGVSEISIPIEPEYAPNVYVTAQVVRSPKGLDRRAAIRAFGITSLPVDTQENRLNIELSMPETIRPDSSMDVEIQVSSTDHDWAGRQAVVTLAAVDEGICQITGYDAPSPFDYFYGKKRLSVSTHDPYSSLLSDPRPATISGSPGGDIDELMAHARQRHLNPVSARRVKPVSIWSGLVQTDKHGKATISLSIPEFNGTLRLMAVAASAKAFGSYSTTAVVQDEVVVMSTLPRFAATGDSFDIPVFVRNATGSDGLFSVELSVSGPLRLTAPTGRQVSLCDGEESVVLFSGVAEEILGTVSVTATASGNGSTGVSRTELPVRPASPLVTKVSTGSVTQAASATLKTDLRLMEGTASYSLSVGPLPTAQFGPALQYLVHYPYGCLEQTVSSCFPLLYFRDLAAQCDERMTLTDVSYFVEKGIAKIESMQLPDGSFSYWPGTFDRSVWSSIYATHFMVEARNAGYLVSERVYQKALDHLETLANTLPSDDEQIQCRVYALYVLSLAGQPSLGNLAYAKRNSVSDLPAFSRAQLAAALALAGDSDGARQVAPNKVDAVPSKPQTGSTFRAPARDDAIMLHALVSSDPDSPSVYALLKRLVDSMGFDGTWGTTQSTAFALLALGKAASIYESPAYTGDVTSDGSLIAEFDSSSELVLDDSTLSSALKGRGVTVSISGKGTAYYALTASGVPLAPTTEPESDSGIRVRREFLTSDGEPVDLDAIQQGDVIISHISVTPQSENLDNVVIVDMLAAGLEIENPRLGRDVYLSWAQTQNLKPEYMDIRDDRLVLFASFQDTGEYHFYYAVRAVTSGSFALPPIKAECMYDPSIHSTSGKGNVTVKESIRRVSP